MTEIFHTPTKWLRVSKLNPCPICHKPDWCLIAANGTTSICARIESDKQAGQAGWLHQLGSLQYLPPKPVCHPSVAQMPIAPVSVRDKVYRILLGALSLSDEHRHQLLTRGLSAPQIQALNYSSLPPSGRSEVVRHLNTQGVKLAGVPGFYLDGEEVHLAGPSGIVIPIRDIQKRMIALHVRCDNSQGGKYKWISSSGLLFGCSPGSPIHVANHSQTDFSEIWITEGPLKADIAALSLPRIFLAVSGVGNWHGVIPILHQLKPQRVIICFDMDKTHNQTVRLHLDALTAGLLQHGFRTFEADWDAHFKGIDDLLREAR